jgi:arylsulfatase A
MLAALLPACFAADKPNVVILYSDDQGTLDAKCFGASDLFTPNIDKLSATGVKFTQAYSHTVCCPARAALMTGRHPQRGGVNNWTQGDMNGPDGINMALEEVTIAEALQAAGYRTALFGKWHLGAHRDFGPEKQGFDEFFGIRDGFIDNYNHYFLHGTGFHDLYEGTTQVKAEGSYFPELMVERSLKFIDENKDRPFFLFVPFNIPHYPTQALPEYSAKYSELPEPRRSYAAMVSTTDYYLGKIVDKLESAGLREKTIVIFQSDNGHSTENAKISVENHKSGLAKGTNYGANGGGGYTGRWLGAKASFLEGGIRVPAVLSYPAKVPGNIVREQAITAMDWFPTVLEFCGVKPPAGVAFDGHSLLPLLDDAAAPSRYSTMHWAWQDRWAVREGSWKLLFNDRGSGGRPPFDRVHLANLDDPQPEATNYAAERPEVVTRLTRLHDLWDREVTTTTVKK